MDYLHICYPRDDWWNCLVRDDCRVNYRSKEKQCKWIGSIMFHVRRRPADAQPRRRKKKPLGASNGGNNTSTDREGPVLVEVTHSSDSGRRIKLGLDPIEVGSANTNSLQLFGPSIQARHCLISLLEGFCTVTPLHADALTFVNGHHVTQPTILHNGSVVMIGRVASYRFLDSPSDGRFNLALSQSQLDSACLYESRSPTLPASWNKEEGNISTTQSGDVNKATNNNHTNIGLGDDYKNHLNSRSSQKQLNTLAKEIELNYEAAEQSLDSETKSIISIKSTESHNLDQRSQNKVSGVENQGQELILPAVLEFPEKHQEQFLSQILTELDVNLPHFKLAPVYSLYLCARYRASTHYRPELQPTERAHKLTIFLHHVANLMYSIIQGQYTNARVLAFWMANSSEFLHFLKSDRHISAFSIQAQEILAECVQTAFHNLVNCFRVDLSQTLNQFLSETIDHDSSAGLVLTVLGSAMALLRRCRVNAALTIQLFSQLFHYINAMCFNMIVTNSHMCTPEWGKLLTERLLLLELWAERQGLELAADCHLGKINQCAQFLQSPKKSIEEIQKLTCSCFRLNSLQLAALMQQEKIPRNLIDTAIRMAESVADELTRADGREVRLEESPELHLVLLLPDDGFSCDVVRGIPSGLLDFLNPLQSAGICRLAAQPTSIGLWTVYMHQFNARSPSEMSNKLPQPEVQVIKLQKNSNGMGLSIVAAKGAGQEQLGIYIKSVVAGGAADTDNRLQAGDQLLRVDGQSLVGITQERAADYLVRTGPFVTLEVAKQGAIYHGLATLLQQPSPITQRGNRSQKDASITESDFKSNEQLSSNLSPSKSAPILHHPNKNISSLNSNSRYAQSLSNNNEQGFYQNLSAYGVQNQNQPVFGERPPTDSSIRNSLTGIYSKSIQQLTLPSTQQVLTNQNINRPASAYYQGSTYPNYIENTKNTPNLLANNMLISSDNLGKSASSLNVNVKGNNSTHQLNTQQNNQEPQPFLNIGSRSKSSQNFGREGQSQNCLRMNQTLAPSMPNISDARTTSLSPQIYNTGLLTSQSMQNVATINQLPNQVNTQQPQDQQQRFKKSVQTEHQMQKNSGCFQPSLGDNSVISNNSNQIITVSNSQLQPELFCSNVSKPNGNKYNLTAFSVASSTQQHQPNIPNSQLNRSPQNHQKQPTTEKSPPLPPTTTHPLFKGNSQSPQGVNCVSSSSESQRGSFYPINTSLIHHGQFAAANPWEREEREKEQEIRREHIKIWRDKRITNLSNLPHRIPLQEEQLKTLVLEREFQRRAHEAEEQEEDSEPSFIKENEEEESFRTHPSSIQVSNTNLCNTENEVKQDIGCLENRDKVSKNDSQASLLQSQPTIAMQPKGILKNNRCDSSTLPISTVSTLPFITNKNKHDLRHNHGENEANSASKNVSNLNLDMNAKSLEHLVSGEHTSQSSSTLPIRTMSPPSPPERNISYIVMSQKQQSNNTNSSKLTFPSETEAHNQCNNNVFLKCMPSQTLNDTQLLLNSNAHSNLLVIGRDTKRVSFHDEENNYVPSQTPVSANKQNRSCDKMNIHSPCDLDSVSNQIMLSPQTPEADLWNLTVKSTPGVIGAQEVYRDPRQRRLAEQYEKEQQRSCDAVPEKLSFKEKMKMFALESGEDQTPKDKLKISRAQRDIDAAH